MGSEFEEMPSSKKGKGASKTAKSDHMVKNQESTRNSWFQKEKASSKKEAFQGKVSNKFK